MRVVTDGDFSYPTGPHSFPRDIVDTAFRRAGVTAPLYEQHGAYRMFSLPRNRHYGLLRGDEEWKTTAEKFNLSTADAAEIKSILGKIDPETWQGKTAARWMQDMGFSPRVQRLLATSANWATDCGLTADVISMDLFPMSVFAIFLGGMPWTEFCHDQQLNDAFCAKVGAKGNLEFAAEVVRVEVGKGAVKNVLYRRRDDGSLWRARAPVVISNIPILEMWGRKVLCAEELPHSFRARIKGLEALEPFLGGFITNWYALREPIVDTEEANEASSVCIFDEDPEIGTHTVAKGYFRIYSNTVPTLATGKKQLVEALYAVRPHERGGWKEVAEKAVQLDSLARDYVKRQGWKPLEDVVEVEKTIATYHTWGGYNWSIFRPLLPDVSVPEVAGLYFVGNMVQSTPGHLGVGGATDSGIRCADLIISRS